MALANKDDPISNGVIYCYEVSVDLGALNYRALCAVRGVCPRVAS